MSGVIGLDPQARRRRRSRADIERLRAAIFEVAKADRPVTVRQVFYRLVSSGHIAKTEREYKNTVVRLLKKMRLDGTLPFGWIADNTRWMRKPRTYDGVDAMLKDAGASYRRAVWTRQPYYVEVWLEKEALAGAIYEETEQWDVPLMVTRGYASLSYLHEAASALSATGKPARLFYLGDHDPSGEDIPRNVEARLREFAPDVDLTFERLAVLPYQVELLDLPTRPTKKTDSRAKGFKGDSVEVDAIPPHVLRELVRGAVEDLVDPGELERLRDTELAERAIIERLRGLL